jgi:chemotaxis protein histidine kinase CheA
MSQYLNDVVYVKDRTIRVQGIEYVLYVPTIRETFSDMKIRDVYDTMKTKHKDVYDEFHKIKRDTVMDKAAGLVKAMRNINGTRNWKDNQYIWFHDDRGKYYAVAPENDQHDFDLGARPISYETETAVPLWQLLMDDDEPDYYSDDEAREAGEAEDKRLAEYDAKEREKDKREDAAIAKIDAAAAKKTPEAKKARQLVRKQNEQERVVSRKALAQHFKDEKAEAKRAAKVVSDAKKAKIATEEKAKKAAEKEIEKAKKAAEKEIEKAKKAAEKSATKKNKTVKTDVNTILGGIRNKKSATKSRTQKRGRNSK